MSDTSLPADAQARVLEQLEADALLRLINYRLDKIESIGAGQYRCFCPIHKETIFRTLAVDGLEKKYSCTYNFCAGHKGGDLLDLAAKAWNVERGEAARRVAVELNLDSLPAKTGADASKRLEVAVNLLELNAPEEAVAAFKSVLENEPLNVRAHEGLAQCYARMGDAEAAIAELQVLLHVHQEAGDTANVARVASRLIELRPQDPENYYLVIEAFDQLGDDAQLIEYRQALVQLLDSLGRSDETVDLLMELEEKGIASLDSTRRIIAGLLGRGDHEKAVEVADLRLARFGRENDAEGIGEVLSLLVGAGAAEQRHLKRFFEHVNKNGLSPRHLERCLAGAARFAKADKPDQALELLEGIERRAKGNAEYMRARASVLAAKGDGDAAQAVRLALVDRLVHDGQLDEAGKLVEEMLSDDLGNVEALKRQVEIHEARGDEEAAMEVCLQIIDELKVQDRPSELLAFYEKLASYEPDNLSLRADFIAALSDAGRKREAGLAATMMAEELAEASRMQEAIDVLLDLAKRLPDNAEVIAKAGDLLASQSEPAKAAESFARAADIKKEQGKAPEALAYRRKAAAASPEDLAAQEALALALVDVERQEEAADVLRRVADRMLDRGDAEGAERAMSKVFEIAPEDTGSLRVMARIFGSRKQGGREAETLLKLAEKALEKRQFAKCADVVGEILRVDPANLRAMELRVDALERANKLSEALSACFDLANALIARGESAKAEPLLRRALALDPSSLAASEKLLDVLLRDDRPDEAVEIGLGLVAACRRVGEIERARSVCVALLEVAPASVPAREVALELAREAEDAEGVVEQANALISVHREAGDTARVCELYRMMIEADPENLDLRLGLFEALRAAGEERESVVQGLFLARKLRDQARSEEAVRRYRDVLALNDDNEAARAELAELQADLGDAADACALYLDLARRMREREDAPAAIGALRKAAAADRRNPEPRRQLIELLIDDQRIDEAVDAYLDLYNLYHAQEKRSLALETLEEAIGVKPDHAELRSRRVEELRAGGEHSAADRAALELAVLMAKHGDKANAEALLDELASHDPAPAGLEEARRQLAGADSDAAEDAGDGKERKPSFGKKPARPGSSAEPDSRGERFLAGLRRSGPEKKPVKLSLVEDYRFDNFVVGDENQFAYATAMAVSKSPGQQYNPLFIHGDVGVGKTHLINALALAAREANPDIAILYTGTDEFVTQLVAAIQTNSVSALRDNYRSTDILLIDDIQFLSNKERAQEEFFHVFNALFQAGKQIILTSDRPPREIAHLQERLTSRFGAGVIVDVKPPGVETRMAIVRSEMKRRGLEPDDEIVSMIAHRVDGSVRDLKGAVTQLKAMAELSGQQLTLENAAKVIESHFAKPDAPAAAPASE